MSADYRPDRYPTRDKAHAGLLDLARLLQSLMYEPKPEALEPTLQYAAVAKAIYFDLLGHLSQDPDLESCHECRYESRRKSAHIRAREAADLPPF